MNIIIKNTLLFFALLSSPLCAFAAPGAGDTHVSVYGGVGVAQALGDTEESGSFKPAIAAGAGFSVDRMLNRRSALVLHLAWLPREVTAKYDESASLDEDIYKTVSFMAGAGYRHYLSSFYGGASLYVAAPLGLEWRRERDTGTAVEDTLISSSDRSLETGMMLEAGYLVPLAGGFSLEIGLKGLQSFTPLVDYGAGGASYRLSELLLTAGMTQTF